MRPTWLIIATLLGGSGLAQTAPDDEWAPPPQSTAPAPAPPPTVPPLPPLPVPLARFVRPVVNRTPEEPNVVSMFGAPALGQWKRGQAFVLGFPLITLRASLGLLETLDVGVGFDSFYGTMNEPRLLLKWCPGSSGPWTFAGSLEGGAAFFSQRAARELRGARWLTGQRNFNVSPGVVVSYQGPLPRSARLFAEGRYLLAFDTEPYARDPLGGVPSDLVLGHNVTLHLGAELPLSKKTSFVFFLGLEIHGRADDAPVMPVCSVGLVTGL